MKLTESWQNSLCTSSLVDGSIFGKHPGKKYFFIKLRFFGFRILNVNGTKVIKRVYHKINWVYRYQMLCSTFYLHLICTPTDKAHTSTFKWHTSKLDSDLETSKVKVPPPSLTSPHETYIFYH